MIEPGTRADSVRTARLTVGELERQLLDARSRLALELQTAQQEGATIAQLMEWSGYSRRSVFNLLKQ